MKMGRIHPRQAMVDDVGMVPAERQTAVSMPMRTKIFRMLPMVRTPLPHRPAISRGRKPRRKACPVKHSRPKAKAHSKDAPVTMHRASPPRNSDMTTAFMDMIPFHARPGLSNAFPPGKQARPACCPLQDMPGRSARSADAASPAHDAKARPPGIKRPGCIYFVPAALPAARRPGHPPNAGLMPSCRQPTGRGGYGQSPAWSLLPEEAAPQGQHRQQETGCAYSALPKKSFRAATAWVTYSGLSYRSTWLAPSTTWIFLGSLARR